MRVVTKIKFRYKPSFILLVSPLTRQFSSFISPKATILEKQAHFAGYSWKINLILN